MFINRKKSCFAEYNIIMKWPAFFLAGSFGTANKLRRSCFQVMSREVAYGPQLSPKTRGRKGDRHVQVYRCSNKKPELKSRG